MTINLKNRKVIVLSAAAVVLVGVIIAVTCVLNMNNKYSSIQIGYKTSDTSDIVTGNAATLNKGDDLQLYLIYTSEKDKKADVNWTVVGNEKNKEDNKIVTVSNKGLVKAENDGTAIIKASIGKGKNASEATLTVKVTATAEDTAAIEIMKEIEELEQLANAEKLTAEDKGRIEALQEKYNNLSEEAKQLVGNENKLQSVTDKVNELAQKEEPTTAPVQNNADKPNDNQTTSKPSGGGNATKPNTPPPTTSKPQKPATPPTTSAPKPTEPEAPAGFAMTPEEIIAYANSICDSYGRLHYYEDMSKETDAWNVPSGIYPEDSVATIKKRIQGAIASTYRGDRHYDYKIYVENLGNKYKVYFLYGPLNNCPICNGGPAVY